MSIKRMLYLELDLSLLKESYYRITRESYFNIKINREKKNSWVSGKYLNNVSRYILIKLQYKISFLI